MATAATAEARRRIIAVSEVVFGDIVVAAVPRAPGGRTSVPRRGGPCFAASDRDMNWPRVPGGGLFL